ncbi:hypothetical protein FOMPIDRAFT_1163203, partial [Fomitopsis schrenkii]
MKGRIQGLPAEICLRLTRYLTIQSIRSLKLSSRYLNEVISSNEWTVYHDAALIHAYVVDDQLSLSEAKIQNSRYLVGLNTVSRQCFVLDTKWAGISKIDEARSKNKTRGYCTESRDVHRFKVDEQRGLLFTSGRGEVSRSAITVTSLQTGKTLWQTQPGYIRKRAHVEYDNGYLVFDAKTNDGEKEVWRLADEMDDQAESTMPPDGHQIRQHLHTKARFGASGPGVLRPWAFMPSPEAAHTFHLVYPTLLAVSKDTAYLWDITTGTLEQTLPGLQTAEEGTEPLGEIRSVDVNAEHIVLCGENEVHVIARAGGALVFRMPGKTGFAKTVLWPDIPPPHQRTRYKDAPLTERLEAGTVVSSAGERPWKQFRAAHLSACGRDLACLLQDGRLVLIRDFEGVAEQGRAIEDAALEVNFTYRRSRDKRVGYCLAFKQGRVAVVTSAGMFVVTLDACTRRLLDREPPPPIIQGKGKGRATDPPIGSPTAAENARASDVVITFLLRMSDRELMADVSCVQMSATCVYVVYKASRVELQQGDI